MVGVLVPGAAGVACGDRVSWFAAVRFVCGAADVGVGTAGSGAVVREGLTAAGDWDALRTRGAGVARDSGAAAGAAVGSGTGGAKGDGVASAPGAVVAGDVVVGEVVVGSGRGAAGGSAVGEASRRASVGAGGSDSAGAASARRGAGRAGTNVEDVSARLPASRCRIDIVAGGAHGPASSGVRGAAGAAVPVRSGNSPGGTG
ncbi:hypothetical protein GCM10022220_17340 [Actinocatenispora rupis]|uniref:Uncharacterized protein n=1 Tax=Actinocatenispora rupis TaxID=519421 RepID=A0A8J3J529_9ACTN|nr:hypothetical protein Aru02nite_12180 [Actinocatenispora rupis]